MTQITIDADTLYVPTDNIRTVRVKAWGAGGGGGGGSGAFPQAGGGDGGGGGAYVVGTVRFRKDKGIPITIGAGGAGGGLSGDGATGTPTEITQGGTVRAASGHGGKAIAPPTDLSARSGGQTKDCYGSTFYPGYDGERGYWSISGGIGGRGGDSILAYPDGNGGRGAGTGSLAPPRDAEAGYVPGGGGGGGDALQEFDLSVTGFGGGITASEVTGSQRAFNQAMVADWHTLLTVEIPQQIPGGIMHFDLDSSVPVLNNGLLLDASTGFYGNELHLQGYITVGFTTVLSGRVYFDDAFGHRSNEATWTVTLTGV